MQRIHKYLFHYNVFISLCAVSLVGYFAVLAHARVPAILYLLTFFATLAVYNLFRLYQGTHDFFSDKKAFSFDLIIYSGILCAICYSVLPAVLKLFYILPAILAMAYKFPFLGRNLRSVAFMKVFIIAIVWVSTGVAALLYSTEGLSSIRLYLPSIVAQFLFFIAITIPFDVFDMKKDHMRTFPTVFGAKASIRIALCCLAGYALVHFCTDLSVRARIAHLIVSLATAVVLLFSGHLHKKVQQYYFVDGLILFQLLAVYLIC